MKCPTTGKPCDCVRESIKWTECRGVALEAARNLNVLPVQRPSVLQMARGFERRAA